MATGPLFVADIATLKSKIRLSGVASTSDADDIINEAVLTVRTGFYRELGPPRVAQLVALPFSESPTTENQILRAVANSTEVKWVKAELIRSLPLLFQDGAASQAQIFQDEALFRDASSSQLEQERVRLEIEIQQNLDLLRGSEELASEGHIRVGSPGTSKAIYDVTSCPRPRPGRTVLPAHIRAWIDRDCV